MKLVIRAGLVLFACHWLMSSVLASASPEFPLDLTLSYDWNCDGQPRTTSWTLNSDGTLATGDGFNGTWTMQGQNITLVYGNGVRYEGVVNGSSYEGDIYGRDGTLSGCWTASP